MLYELELYDGNQLIDRIALGDPQVTKSTTVFRVHRQLIENPENIRRRDRRRSRPAREALQRFLDPERERPLLKKLLSTVAPIAISFLTQQLPEWLGDLDLTEPKGTLD